jgi:hypothetical protein
MRMRLCGLGLTLLAVLAPHDSRACSVPVFRYALEHWEASAYPALLFHRGPLAEPKRALLDRLSRPLPTANVKVQVIDLDGAVEAATRQAWDKQGSGAALPWLVLRPPGGDADAADVWAGPLTEANVAALLDSPARRRLVEALGAGDSAVFVLLDSGDKAADDAAAALLEKQAALLSRTLDLPVPTGDGPPVRSTIPLHVAFSVIRVARTDPAEDRFVRALLRAEEGLEAVRGPVVVPVFGRGRALCGLHGASLNEESLRQAAAFLCGACSCQVKELNPGIDLLLSADWEDLLDNPLGDTPNLLLDERDCLTILARRGSSLGLRPPRRPAHPPEVSPLPVPNLPTQERTTEAPSAESSYRRWLWLAAAAALVLTLLTGGWTVRSRGGRPATPPGNA